MGALISNFNHSQLTRVHKCDVTFEYYEGKKEHQNRVISCIQNVLLDEHIDEYKAIQSIKLVHTY